MTTHKPTMELVQVAGDGYVNEVDFDPSHTMVVFLDPATDSEGFWECDVPAIYVGSPFVEVGVSANATTGEARLTADHNSIGDGESLDNTYNAETTIDHTVPATANLLDIIRFPSAGNLTTTAPAIGDRFKFRLTRDSDHANDDLAVALRVHFVRFCFDDA